MIKAYIDLVGMFTCRQEDEEDSSHATEIDNDHQSNAADVQNVVMTGWPVECFSVYIIYIWLILTCQLQDGKTLVIPRVEYRVAEAEQEKFDVRDLSLWSLQHNDGVIGILEEGDTTSLH